MTEIGGTTESATYLERDRAPCKRCGTEIDTDVAACPHCGNRPAAAIKLASVGAMLVGAILAVTTSNVPLAFWFAPLTGIGSFVGGAGVYWVVTDRYSPTKYDSGARVGHPDSESTGH